MAALAIVEAMDGGSATPSTQGHMPGGQHGPNLHMLTMFALISFPKVRYPVTATRMYTDAAEPMLAATTPTILPGELSLISFNIENI